MDAEEIQALLPPLDAAPGPVLRAGGSADGLRFSALELTGDATLARFLECVLEQCDLGDVTSFERARIATSVLSEVRAAALSLGDATLLDVALAGGRFGALTLRGAHLTRVLVQDLKVDFVDLRAGTLVDVTFTGCDIGEVDASGADLRSVRWVDCRIGSLELSGSRSRSVDLSGAEIRRLDGVDHLRGCTISSEQLGAWSAGMAAQLGISVA